MEALQIIFVVVNFQYTFIVDKDTKGNAKTEIHYMDIRVLPD